MLGMHNVTSRIGAVIFDFDGLILDTETPEYRSFRDLFRANGSDLELEVWGQWVGTDAGAFNPYDLLDERVGLRLDREQIRAARRASYESLMAEQEVRPGVREYLADARRLGLGIGLASSSTRAWVTGHLERHGLLDAFDCIRTKDDVACVKPDPELYVQALHGLGVSPLEAVAFEDSPNGALAAERAGLRCVVVPNELTAGLAFGAYDFRLASMKDFRLQELLDRLVEIVSRDDIK
jgi:HAD superfamily hydrolase (TIGR01509 family)